MKYFKYVFTKLISLTEKMILLQKRGYLVKKRLIFSRNVSYLSINKNM